MSERETALKDAAEMLWVLLANVSGGDWTKQTEEWQQAAARWRDNYFAVALAQPVDAPQPCVWRLGDGLTYRWTKPDCREELAVDLDPRVWEFAVCPYCGSPLSVVPAAQETTTPSAKE